MAAGIGSEQARVKVEESTHVTVTVQGEPDIAIVMRIRRKVPLQILMLTYCDKVGLEYGAVRFCFDGKRMKDLQTADDLGLEDGDVIDALGYQYGGGNGTGRGGVPSSNQFCVSKFVLSFI